MEKPITVLISETRGKMINTVNDSGLPLFILDSILKDLYGEIHALSIQQEERDRKEYEQALAESRPENKAGE